MTNSVSLRFDARVFCVVLIAGSMACSADPTAAVSNSGLRISASNAASTDISVTAATPDSATQDTTVDVTISGSGFVAGSTATWALSGVADPTQVKTNRTTYISSKKIIANITISGTATVAKWDVQVTAGTKGGIGTEMFAIKVHGNISTDTKPNVVWDETVNVAPIGQPAMWQPALITGDYRKRDGSAVTDGSSGEYQFSFCGSDAFMQNAQMTYPQAALNFDPDHFYDPTTMDAACGGKRYYQFFFSGRSTAPLRFGPQHFALHLGDLAVGQILLEEVHFGIQQTDCSALHFNDIYPPANNARVTRIDDTVSASGVVQRRWRVESQGSHRAMCTLFTVKGPKPTGVTYYLPFAFTVTELHYPFPHYP